MFSVSTKQDVGKNLEDRKMLGRNQRLQIHHFTTDARLLVLERFSNLNPWITRYCNYSFDCSKSKITNLIFGMYRFFV